MLRWSRSEDDQRRCVDGQVLYADRVLVDSCFGNCNHECYTCAACAAHYTFTDLAHRAARFGVSNLNLKHMQDDDEKVERNSRR